MQVVDDDDDEVMESPATAAASLTTPPSHRSSQQRAIRSQGLARILCGRSPMAEAGLAGKEASARPSPTKPAVAVLKGRTEHAIVSQLMLFSSSA
jgi:hypothetical protein